MAREDIQLAGEQNEEATAADTLAKKRIAQLKQHTQLRVGEEAKLQKILSTMYENANIQRKLSELKNKEDKEKLLQALDRKSQQALLRYRKTKLKEMTAEEQVAALDSARRKKDVEIKSAEEAFREKIAMIAATAANEEEATRRIDAERRKYEEERIKNALALKKINDDIHKAEQMAAVESIENIQKEKEESKSKLKQDKKHLKETLDGSGSFVSKVRAGQKFLREHPLERKSMEDYQQDYKKSKESYDTAATALAEARDSGASDEEIKRLEEAVKNGAKQANTAAANVMAEAVKSAISSGYKEQEKNAETILNDYMGSIDARMQGSDKNFKDMSNLISSNLSISPFVKTTKVLEKLKEAADKGINYNIEQRTFLASLTDKIAATFDAFDSNLLRIIRLQQADSTASRLGMEASLTKLFNNMFQDTSYLSDVADSISGAIVDAQSQLNYQASAEFEYVIQKWLGALSSLGMSSESLTQIATGLNYLATGDVTNLASNNSLQTMFAMAAANANMEYSEILLNGLDANNTNKLLESVIVYLKEIADNSENQVVKSAYGDIFNLSHSDMRALSNLTQAEISSLSGNMMSYNDMQSELSTQFKQLKNRTSIATMMTNVYENVLYGVASDMVNNPLTFSMSKMLDFLGEKEIDINIPFVNAFGTGLDLNTSVVKLMRMGLGIGQGLSLAGNLLSGLSSGGGLNLDGWNATETTQRGSGLNLTSLSTLGGTSGSIGTYATSGNSEDISNSTISGATDDAEKTKKITNKNLKQQEKTLDDLFKAIVGDSAQSYVVSKDQILESTYAKGYDAINVRLKGLNLLDGTIPVFDAALKSELTDQLNSIKELMTTNITVGVQQVKLVEGTVFKIPKETLSSAIREVLFDNDEDKNFNTLLEIIESGSLKVDEVKQAVPIKNNAGDKIQVSNLVW